MTLEYGSFVSEYPTFTGVRNPKFQRAVHEWYHPSLRRDSNLLFSLFEHLDWGGMVTP